MIQGTNVLFGQIAVVFGIVIAWGVGATQWTAAALGYQLRRRLALVRLLRYADLSPVAAVRVVVVLLRCLRAARVRHRRRHRGRQRPDWPVVVAIGMSVRRSR